MQFIVFTLLSLKARFEDVKQKERGATAVEYGLMVALIAAAIIVTVGLLGDELDTLFDTILTAIEGATP
jgi:pilus assembly protein Flp/PilA